MFSARKPGLVGFCCEFEPQRSPRKARSNTFHQCSSDSSDRGKAGTQRKFPSENNDIVGGHSWMIFTVIARFFSPPCYMFFWVFFKGLFLKKNTNQTNHKPLKATVAEALARVLSTDLELSRCRVSGRSAEARRAKRGDAVVAGVSCWMLTGIPNK